MTHRRSLPMPTPSPATGSAMAPERAAARASTARAGFGALVLLGCGVIASPAGAAEKGEARIFQCFLPDGRKITSDKPIVECTSNGKSLRQLNSDGSERGVVEAPLTADE